MSRKSHLTLRALRSVRDQVTAGREALTELEQELIERIEALEQLIGLEDTDAGEFESRFQQIFRAAAGLNSNAGEDKPGPADPAPAPTTKDKPRPTKKLMGFTPIAGSLVRDAILADPPAQTLEEALLIRWGPDWKKHRFPIARPGGKMTSGTLGEAFELDNAQSLRTQLKTVGLRLLQLRDGQPKEEFNPQARGLYDTLVSTRRLQLALELIPRWIDE